MKSIHLQGFGEIEADFASSVKVGDILIWNFGTEEKIQSIEKENDKTIWVKISGNNGFTGIRRMLKTRLVAIKK